MNSSKTRKDKQNYYGGDKLDLDNDDEIKLYLNDCQKRQSLLYEFQASNLISHSFYSQLHNFDSFISSGLSRIHVFSFYDRMAIIDEKLDGFITSLSFKNCKLQNLPTDLEEEFKTIRLHGFPLLIWPKFTSHYYPDCYFWLSELSKSTIWLNEKWKPLMEILGFLNQSPSMAGVSVDSLVSILIHNRYTFYIEYVDILKNYFQERIVFSPGFRSNLIHKKMINLKDERCASIQDDSAFLNLIGERLIIARAAAGNRTFTKEMVLEAIACPEQRKEFLAMFLNKSNAKKFLSSSQNDGHSEIDSSNEEGMLSDDGADNIVDTERGLIVSDLPNRPVSRKMMDNKGIVKYRHKRERNPRVHLKYKYKKATIRYRSRTAPLKNQLNPYEGETKGIRPNQRSKSMKF